MKIKIEIHICGDKTFINFWNWETGDDVIAELRNGKLFMDTNGVEAEVTLQKYIDEVIEKYKV